jgi:hypothetical protein
MNKDEQQEELPYIQQLRWFAIFCALFAFILLADIYLPHTCEKDYVTKRFLRKEVARFGGYVYDLTIITEKHTFKVDPPLFALAKEGDELEICISGILGKVLEVGGIDSDSSQGYRFKILNRAYRGYGAFPIILVILSSVTVFFKKDDTIAYSSGIIMLVFAIATVILLI